MSLSETQLIEILSHNSDNSRDDDIWLLDEHGNTTIVPDQDIAEFQSPYTWPKYLCRSGAVNNIVQDRGLYAGLELVNQAIAITGVDAATSPVRAMASLTRSAVATGYHAIRTKTKRGEGA